MVDRLRVVAALFLVFTLLLAACSQNDPAPTIEPTEAPVMFTVIGENILGGPVRSAFAFEGEDLDSPGPTITVRSGQSVSITFKNSGERMPADHNFVVVAERTVDAEPMWGAETEVLDPGEQQTITFTPDTAGSFFYICTVDTHMTNGMWGELIVED